MKEQHYYKTTRDKVGLKIRQSLVQCHYWLLTELQQETLQKCRSTNNTAAAQTIIGAYSDLV